MLFLQTKFLRECESTLRILLLQIFEMRLARGDHAEEAPAGVVVFRVRFEVLRELLNALRQYGNLHLGRARISVVKGYFLDELNFLGLGNHSLIVSRFLPLCKPFSLIKTKRMSARRGAWRTGCERERMSG